MMLYLGWIFLWLVSRERIKGFNISDCSTKKLIWTYHARSEEEFFLFCDLPELQKSHFFHRSQISPTQVPERVPCSGSKDIANVQWYLQPQNGDPLREITRDHPHIKSALHFSTIRMNDAGSYICRPRIRSTQDDACCIKMILEVKPKRNTSFSGFEHKHKQSLLLGSIDPIYCPSLHCQSDTQCPQVTWYQNGKLLSEKRGNPLRVGEIYNHHRGTYVCDYTQSANASLWIVRAVVQVETIVKNTNFKPDILEPEKDTMEAELGKPLALNCKVRFGFEKDFKPVVRWYIKDPDQEQEVPLPEGSSNTSMLKDEVIQHVLSLEEVTQNDLQRKFICFAKNSVGSTTRSIQLKNKKGAVFIYILLGTILTLVGVLLASALLYTYWIEVVLLYRTYQSKDETLGDKKEFDAFVSYAKSSSLESEVTSSPSEENLALNLLPEVLENKYGYTLCLLERDVAPGGVYAEEIVSIIKKSRRGIFILSPSYVNGPSVFELQAAVNLALDDRTLKLILIKFRSFEEPESLPHLVKKALGVLPTITWKGLKSVPPNSRFWAQVRYHMPVKNPKGLTWNHLRMIPRIFSLERTK
ncbi:interleukin-18 receptor accessory protein [Elephas maximus indicus]|uniref:interleukin-18 receptor accessory protein n=1 Tax=Elephas maximus indicus TaxID=99487 RepID=UPI002116825E|nr:interleukin-18 receptor accessory protein [Elephas maximus indicus]XP_049712976.1 interleukin-18 receptor accessory protein [Elephas maximus indicus]XP_049712977.1 interleukin-18 receptor accessory protein [Elephas maximus indicus]